MKTLIVHSEDVNYKPYFPNASSYKKVEFEMWYVWIYTYRDLRKIKDNSFELVICTGLLEHARTLYSGRDLREYQSRGKVIISAVLFFLIMRDWWFFHFTPYEYETPS